ncbi:MAG: Txe/YoeB family addiction module toxin [Prevotellaceae bacterium]|jgi:toxin YoeB|nr:Txe/YoeB family addiction module toxin [Prevotellaceae bacterium]
MEVTFSPEAMEDYEYWKKVNSIVVKRIKLLLADICEHPHAGIGKPERLRYELSGWWSRRINAEHRLVYAVRENGIYVLALRYHY